MSLAVKDRVSSSTGFPRVSGDEPQLSATPTVKGEFSPRERG